MRRIPIAACLTLSISSMAARAGQADSRPAPSESVSTLVDRLADPDPVKREQAGKSLWSMGRPAEAALRAAAAEPNPEIARRAKAILRDFTYGLYPDAPHEIFTLLDQYRGGDPQEKRAAVLGLGNAGIPGIRVLLKLREDERDPNWKLLISQVLAPREHEVSVLMLADGQAADVEQILSRSAFDSPIAAQDYAAMLLFNGKLKDELAHVKSQPITPRSAPVLVALARAAGDAATARAAAEKAADPELLDAILIEQGQWAELARRIETGGQRLQPAERLGFLCAYYRLAGDQQKSDAAAGQLSTLAVGSPQEYERCAENLFLNNHPDQAIAVLQQHAAFLQLTEFLASRLQFAEALKLPEQAERRQSPEALEVKARTVGTLQFLGLTSEGGKLLDQVVAENRLRNDFATWASLIESARESGTPDKADEFAAIALEKATRESPISLIFEKLRLGDGASAAQWWRFFRQQYREESAADSLHRLHLLFDARTTGPDLESLSESARRYSLDLPVGERATWEQIVPDMLVSAGRDDLALKWIERLEDGGTSALLHAGDYRANHKDWSVAARDYERAWNHDRTRADALFLRGWALSQSGQGAQGAGLMQQARRLPLGSEAGRYELADALARHKLKDEADKEFGLLLQITPSRSWERNEALRRTAEDLATGGNELAAADRWDKAFLQNLSNNVNFLEPWANVMVPALIHKTRALGLIRAGRIDAALADAKVSLAEAPGDADALIELVNALDANGHRAEADTLYASHTALYRKLIATYPNSGPLHNQLAWAQVMCHREIEESIANGKRAVELEPFSTASRDTLAEALFADRNPGAAAAQMQKCIDLEPRVERHKKQLARFQAAMTQPATRE